MNNLIAKLIAATALVLGVVACGGGGSNGDTSNTGTLTVGLTDATVDMVEQVRLYVTGVTVKPENGPPVSYPVPLADCMGMPGESDDCNPLDLLALENGLVLTLLADQEMVTGRYQWLRIEVDEEFSYIVEGTGLIDDRIEVRIPSARGLQLSGGFTILADRSTHIVADWDARKGLTNPVGQDGYILKPSIRITDMSEYGAVTGSIDDGLMMNQCADNAVVYVFQDDLIAAAPADPAANLDDIDNNDPEPLVTATVKQRSNGSYGYAVDFLPVGTYTVALTCDVDNVPTSDTDPLEADDDITFFDPQVANVADGQTEEINF